MLPHASLYISAEQRYKNMLVVRKNVVDLIPSSGDLGWYLPSFVGWYLPSSWFGTVYLPLFTGAGAALHRVTAAA